MRSVIGIPASSILYDELMPVISTLAVRKSGDTIPLTRPNRIVGASGQAIVIVHSNYYNEILEGLVFKSFTFKDSSLRTKRSILSTPPNQGNADSEVDAIFSKPSNHVPGVEKKRSEKDGAMTRKITFWMMSGLFASLFALVACQQQKRDELRQELDASFSQPDANANPGEALIDAGQPDALGVDASFGMDASEALDAGPQAPTIFNPMDAGDF